MLTREQKIFLENKIYESVKKYLREWKDYEDKEDDGSVSKEKKETILNWLNSDTVNQAEVAYRLYDAETDSEKASARSLFYKKLHGEKNDNGVPYKFTNEELNEIASILGELANH